MVGGLMRALGGFLLDAAESLMGTAGLDVKRLAGLLERMKIECTLLDEDATFDHCVLRLSSVKRPADMAVLEYKNQGVEPRFVGLVFRDAKFITQKEDYPLEWEKTLKLVGARREDTDKIAQWVESEYLNRAS